ncbi:MAG: efflux RND transporter periplasmic adaptor subunit [Proteobacteria bacterium]|nr:efflux RND transporter periplasmic adaptor subunit [Pseudomonadota bacterium]
MRKILTIILPVLLIIVAGILAFGVFPKLKDPPEKVDAVKKAVLVDAMAVERRSLRFNIESQGIVRPRTETTLAAEVSGKVTRVATEFIAGGFLDKGEVLLEIDPSDYRVGVKRAEAAKASRVAQLSSEQARSDQALNDWRRLHGGEGRPNDLVLRIPQLAEAKANVRAADADLERAQRDLQRTRIRMPYAGMVREKLVDIGQYVTPGTRLGATFAVDLAEIRLPITNEELNYIDLPDFRGNSTESLPLATLSSGSAGHSWQARIVRSEGVIDEKSRQVYLVAQINDPYGLLGQSHQQPLKIGTFVHAEIEGRTATNLFVVPRHSLGDGNQVMVVTAENTLEFRKVDLVRATPKEAYIYSGLDDGDRVITTALTAPIDGMDVRVRGDEEKTKEDLPGDSIDQSGSGDEDDPVVAEPAAELATGDEEDPQAMFTIEQDAEVYDDADTGADSTDDNGGY